MEVAAAHLVVLIRLSDGKPFSLTYEPHILHVVQGSSVIKRFVGQMTYSPHALNVTLQKGNIKGVDRSDINFL